MGNLVGRTWLAVTHVVSVDETTVAATIGKFFLNGFGDAEVMPWNLETCNVFRKIRLSTFVLRHLQPSLKVSRKSLQNQGLLYWFTELCIVEVLQSTAQWSFNENKTNYWPQNIPLPLLQPLSSRLRKRRAWQPITCDLTSFPFIAR